MLQPVLKLLLLSGDEALRSAINEFWSVYDVRVFVAGNMEELLERNRKCIYHAILLDYNYEHLSPQDADPIINSKIYRPPILHLISNPAAAKEIDEQGTDRCCYSRNPSEVRSCLTDILSKNINLPDQWKLLM